MIAINGIIFDQLQRLVRHPTLHKLILFGLITDNFT
jgi:hypothetical protein